MPSRRDCKLFHSYPGGKYAEYGANLLPIKMKLILVFLPFFKVSRRKSIALPKIIIITIWKECIMFDKEYRGNNKGQHLKTSYNINQSLVF